MIPLEILNRFVWTEDDTRPGIPQPWTRDGYTYATDGLTAIRVPAMADIPENPKAPDATKFFDGLPEMGENGVRVEALDLPTGTRKDCDDCGGSGEIKCDRCGHAEPCEACKGNGLIYSPAIVEIHGVKFNADLLRRFADLPNARIDPRPEVPARVEFDGGLGAIMPRRY